MVRPQRQCHHLERACAAAGEPGNTIEAIRLSADSFRHTGQWSFADATELLAEDAPSVLSELHHAQRLTVAEEITADASERADAIRVLSSGSNPDLERSRAWQMCEVTRSLRQRLDRPAAGGNGWLVRSWGPGLSPAERWAARNRLVRIEQLVAACKMQGGRAAAQVNPLLVHLVVSHADPREEDDVIYVAAHPVGLEDTIRGTPVDSPAAT